VGERDPLTGLERGGSCLERLELGRRAASHVRVGSGAAIALSAGGKRRVGSVEDLGEDAFVDQRMAAGRNLLVLAAFVALVGRSTPAPVPDVGLPGARPVAYEAIRDASGVLAYAESLLRPGLPVRRGMQGGPGASFVDRSAVVGAWELPAPIRTEELARLLRAGGVLDHVSDFRDGQIWSADYRTHGSRPVRLLLIDGTHPFFESRAVPEARPGPHVYLIVYRTS